MTLTDLLAIVLTFLDHVLINVVIIPLEERELLSRFGDDYKSYRKKVSGFFPPDFQSITKEKGGHTSDAFLLALKASGSI